MSLIHSNLSQRNKPEFHEHVETALRALQAIIEKQKRTIRDVAALKRKECVTDEEREAVNRWERSQLELFEEHFDPSTFRSENPYLCSEEQERALRAFAQSNDLEAWLWSHRYKQMNAAKVAVYASRLRLLIAMTLGQTQSWMISYTPSLDALALECALLARINLGPEEVSERTYAALNEILDDIVNDDVLHTKKNGLSFAGFAFTEIICDATRMPFYEACTRKFIWASAFALDKPEACLLRWLELKLGNHSTRAEVRELLKQTFQPFSDEERNIINNAFLKFVNAYAS